MMTFSMSDLDPGLQQHAQLVSLFQDQRAWLRKDIMLRLWIVDEGFGEFLALAKKDDLSVTELCDRYAGEIIYMINDAKNIEDKFYLRAQVRDFQNAVKEFRNPRNLKAAKKRHQYEDSINKQGENIFNAETIRKYTLDNARELFSALLYSLINCIVIYFGNASKRMRDMSLLLPIILFWLHPQLGKINFYMLLLNRFYCDPVKSAALAVGVEIWIVASTHYDLIHLTCFSILPTLTVFLCMHAMKLQPIIFTDQGKIEITLTGYGCIDGALTKFLRKKRAGFLTRLLIGLTPVEFEWEGLHTVRFEDVDVNWENIEKIVAPSLSSQTMKTLSIINNRDFTDKEAQSLAEMLKSNSSLESLQVAHNYNYNLLQHIAHFILWENRSVGFTQQGACALLSAIQENSDSSVKQLDVGGIVLDETFITKARQLKQDRGVVILGSKAGVRKSIFETFCQNRLVIYQAALCTLTFCLYKIYSVVFRGI